METVVQEVYQWNETIGLVTYGKAPSLQGTVMQTTMEVVVATVPGHTAPCLVEVLAQDPKWPPGRQGQ